MATQRRLADQDAGPGIDEIARVFELSRDLLAVADATGRFVRLNPAWEATLGWSREELMSRPATDFVHPDDVDRTLRLGRPRDEPVPGAADRFENR